MREQGFLKAIYLVSPHGRLLFLGKTHLVKKKYFRNLIGVPLVVVENDKAYGIIILEEPKKINYKQFLQTFDKHMVTREEAERWWGDLSEFYLYPVRILLRFRVPEKVEVPRGAQTFFNVKLKTSQLPDFLVRAMIENEEKVRTIIKEIMDYGEWERFFEKLTKKLKNKED
ncbi:MAG: hypothetical protein QXU40_03880 [Candidatus Pacearchaeota archaeon]